MGIQQSYAGHDGRVNGGAVGAAIGGVILFGESKSLPRLACISLIVAGVIGLKLFSETDVT